MWTEILVTKVSAEIRFSCVNQERISMKFKLGAMKRGQGTFSTFKPFDLMYYLHRYIGTCTYHRLIYMLTLQYIYSKVL